MANLNLGNLYKRVDNLVNKDQSGNTYTPDQFNNDLPFVFYNFMKRKYGLPENPNDPQYFEVSQQISDDFIYLKVWMGDNGTPLLNVDASGKAILPEDYWRAVGLYYEDVLVNSCDNGTKKSKLRLVDTVTQDQRLSRITSPILKPTRKNPIACFFDGYIQIEPKGLNYISFVYLKKPAKAFFDYDIINDEIVFLPQGQRHVNNSVAPQGSLSRTVELQIPEDRLDDVASIMVMETGLRNRDEFAYQAGSKKEQEGI